VTGAAIPARARAGTTVRRRRRARSAASPLQRVRVTGYVILGLQLAGFLAWSTTLYDRFALTIDFSEYQQAWFLIAHGNLDPFITQAHFMFWQNHCELIMWALAWTYWLWPHAVTLLWLQDIFIFGAELVAFSWMCELAQRRQPGPAWLPAAGLVILVGNPWIWWSISWDYHSEPAGMLFALLLARDLFHHRRRAWIWLGPLLTCGDVSSTYVMAIGAGTALASARQRLQGVVLAGTGFAVLALITAIHGNLGSGGSLQIYGYLTSASTAGGKLSTVQLVEGVLRHPFNVLRTLWDKRANIWANTAPAGLPGLGFVWLFPVALIVLAANNLYPSLLFSAPGFQNLALYITMPVGTVAVIAALTRRHRQLAIALTVVVLCQSLGYAAVWLPRTSGQWLRISAPAAVTLARVETEIPESAEVIASQGVLGRFADRLDVHALYGPGPLPVVSRQVWLVVVPFQGLEAMLPSASLQLVAELAGPLHAQLIARANGVWAFRWTPAAGTRTLDVPGGSGSLPAWASPGAVGRPVTSGPVRTWHLTSTGGRGYVSDGVQWQEQPGQYLADVLLSSTGPVNVEVWNASCDVLLTRRSLPSADLAEPVTLPVRLAPSCPTASYAGWGPFQARFLPPPAGRRLEVRVWSSGDEKVNVYDIGMSAAP
jgi:Predicted membrane protein (DUF2079)